MYVKKHSAGFMNKIHFYWYFYFPPESERLAINISLAIMIAKIASFIRELKLWFKRKGRLPKGVSRQEG